MSNRSSPSKGLALEQVVGGVGDPARYGRLEPSKLGVKRLVAGVRKERPVSPAAAAARVLRAKPNRAERVIGTGNTAQISARRRRAQQQRSAPSRLRGYGGR